MSEALKERHWQDRRLGRTILRTYRDTVDLHNVVPNDKQPRTLKALVRCVLPPYSCGGAEADETRRVARRGTRSGSDRVPRRVAVLPVREPGWVDRDRSQAIAPERRVASRGGRPITTHCRLALAALSSLWRSPVRRVDRSGGPPQRRRRAAPRSAPPRPTAEVAGRRTPAPARIRREPFLRAAGASR